MHDRREPQLDVVCQHQVEAEVFISGTRELRKILGDEVPRRTPRFGLFVAGRSPKGRQPWAVRH